MYDDDELIQPWFDHLVGGFGSVSLLDIHTHVGVNVLDGF